MTFTDICTIEPLVEELYQKAKAIREPSKDRIWCPNFIFYDTFKPKIIKLVGTCAAKEELRTSQAYDIVYQRIYDAIPGACRDCSCL